MQDFLFLFYKRLTLGEKKHIVRSQLSRKQVINNKFVHTSLCFYFETF